DRAPVQREPVLALDHTRSLREMPASRDGLRLKAAVVFSMWNTMAAKKFAISVPEDVMAEIDRAAASRGVTRSRFIAQILALAAPHRRDRAIPRALARVFAEDGVADEQRRSARAFQTIGHRAGTEW